ncbi:MAG TPA: nickel-responsive transcriptional regulator NikR [Bacteroidetes bacterium]|nr:nickel-responsive transcriptional regulator NikR [Bacteroidota bacterium]
MKKLVRFGISMEQDLLDTFDHLISHKGYSNRSEAIRDIVREKLVEENTSLPNEHIYAALVYIYDHHKRNLEKSLSSLQHEFYQNIISTIHVHVDHDSCLEVILLQGKAEVIKTLAEKLLSFKGVQHGKLTITTSEKSSHKHTHTHHHKA